MPIASSVEHTIIFLAWQQQLLPPSLGSIELLVFLSLDPIFLRDPFPCGVRQWKQVHITRASRREKP
jgi:hypothetical protein